MTIFGMIKMHRESGEKISTDLPIAEILDKPQAL